MIFDKRMLCGYIQSCVSYSSGEHIFRKIVKQKMGKIMQEAIRKRKMEPEEVRWQV